MLRLIAALVWVLWWAGPVDAKNLCVNSSTGNDATTYADNNGTSACWQTIGRAAWGSTTRSSPNTAEAAAAGDVVLVAGGTYSSALTTSTAWSVLYDPANNGTSGNYITFTCVGDCVLVAEGGQWAVIGADASDYVKWYADVTQGYSWVIQACALTTAPTGCPSDFVLPRQGAGPVICHDTTGCWIEGAVIDGGPGIDWTDNWNGVRLEECTSCTVRNVSIQDFTRAAGSNHNQSCITLYGVSMSTLEHNTCSNAGAGIYFKDTGTTQLQSGNRVRFNRIDTVGEGIAFSITSEDRNYVYQNVVSGVDYGLAVVGGGLSNDWIFNNTVYDIAAGCVAHNGAGSGGRFWNNVCLTSAAAQVVITSGDMPADTVLDLEHNVYRTYVNFYSGTTSRTFANYLATYTDQDQATPASITSDPIVVDAAGGDFRLCTAAGVPAVGCSGASPAINLGVDLDDLDGDGSTVDTINAGAYLTNNEIIGLETSGGGGGGSSTSPVRLRIRGNEQ